MQTLIKLRKPGSRRAALGVVLCITLAVAACSNAAKSDQATPVNSVSSPMQVSSSGESATGSGTPLPKPLPQVVRLTISAGPAAPVLGYATVLLAQYFGEFKKENLDVTLTHQSIQNSLVLLQSGQVAAAPIDLEAALFNALHDGADIRLVAGSFAENPADKQGFYVRKALLDPNGTFNPCELKGKTVTVGGATPFSSTPGLVLSEYLAECHLTSQDVRIVTIPPAEMPQALQQGSVDMALLFDPLWVAAARAGYAKLIVPDVFTSSETAGYAIGAILHSNPAVAAAIVRALVRTQRTYLQGNYLANPTVLNALVQTLGEPAAILKSTPPPVFNPQMTFDTALVKPLQEMFIAHSTVTYNSPLPASSVIDTSILNSITKG